MAESMAFICEEDPIEPPTKRKPPVTNKPENACSIIKEKSQSSEKVVIQVRNVSIMLIKLILVGNYCYSMYFVYNKFMVHAYKYEVNIHDHFSPVPLC